MATLKNLHEMFLHELQDLASAESQILKALPKLIDATEDADLREGLESHLAETEGHLDKVTALLESFGAGRGKTKCAGMAGIIKEGDDLLKATRNQATGDAAIIAAAQKVEHYEMCGYGTVKAWAEEMGHRDAVRVIDSILEEEKAADKVLTDAASSANSSATDARELETSGARARGSRASGNSGAPSSARRNRR